MTFQQKNFVIAEINSVRLAAFINNEEPKGRGRSFFALSEEQRLMYQATKTERKIQKKEQQESILERRSKKISKKLEEAQQLLKQLKNQVPELQKKKMKRPHNKSRDNCISIDVKCL